MIRGSLALPRELAIALALLLAAAAVRADDGKPKGAGGTSAETTWREAATGMEFVLVPGDEFEQGCGDWAGDCFSDAKPPRRVKLRSFWIGKHEVTQGQWRVIMGVNPAQQRPGERFPVERVSWVQAQEFIRRLNQDSGNGKFRLPTEAEWEFACRAGGKPLRYATEGGSLDRAKANYGTEQCCGRDPGDGFSESSPVGAFAPNALGIYDMTGNLWEWVQDTYDGSAYLSGQTVDPVVDDQGPVRVTRGGSFTSSPGISRCVDRRDTAAETRYFDLGFRLVRMVEGPAKKTAAQGKPSDPPRAPEVIRSPEDLPAALVAPQSNWQKWAREHGMTLEKCC